MIQLSALGSLIADEAAKAEQRVLEAVRLTLPDAREDDITTLFAVEAERGLSQATDGGRVAAAVRTDLELAYRACGCAPPSHLAHVTDGLVARLRKQNPPEEKRTGGDFGLLLVEPRFDIRWDVRLDLQRGGTRQGLLVQAKRRSRSGRWNQLTRRQVKQLPERAGYAALLRYEFADIARRRLRSFAWHPLAGLEIPAVAEWLRTGDFPTAVATHELVTDLARGKYGTNDPAVIARDICPTAGSYIVIEVDWEDGPGPEDLVLCVTQDVIEEPVSERQQIRIGARG